MSYDLTLKDPVTHETLQTGVENYRLKCQALEKGYLLFYNNVLFENGLITEQERNQMILEIDHCYPIQ